MSALNVVKDSGLWETKLYATVNFDQSRLFNMQEGERDYRIKQNLTMET